MTDIVSEPAVPEDEMCEALEVDNDHQISRLRVGVLFDYHEGRLSIDRKDNPELHSRALTAWGLYLRRKVALRQKRIRSGCYVYSLKVLFPISVADCEQARKLARYGYHDIEPEPTRRSQR